MKVDTTSIGLPHHEISDTSLQIHALPDSVVLKAVHQWAISRANCHIEVNGAARLYLAPLKRRQITIGNLKWPRSKSL